jgi:hypothetical protein
VIECSSNSNIYICSIIIFQFLNVIEINLICCVNLFRLLWYFRVWWMIFLYFTILLYILCLLVFLLFNFNLLRKVIMHKFITLLIKFVYSFIFIIFVRISICVIFYENVVIFFILYESVINWQIKNNRKKWSIHHNHLH